ncbi:hypothetical protein J3R30DRAFT_3455485 [Lentinula aciculospora]|uniref:Uncharacterized protein n=1 Tax=Lentinula aciculospora TaxID=153920 RepID=A0A9W9DRM7_9AGAR|nr:hypothetical protein J3R30DRAFT_3455485 [Lentinula aciculospora]
MPRILPRLLKKLEETSRYEKTFDRFSLSDHRFRGKSLWRPLPPNPYPSFNPSDYSQSILLTPGNPITSSRDYIRRKTLPPRVNIPENAQKRKRDVHDKPRKMTEEERVWWASPYLRMLSTPLRKCLQTQHLLPSAFLIRLGVFRAPSSKPLNLFSPNSPPEAVLLPDGLEHPKFRGRRSGKGGYVLCWKDAVEHLRISGSYKRIAFNSRLPSVLDQIRHLLRLRVLQELQLVVDALPFRPRKIVDHDKPLVRRLTRAEWHELKSTGVMPVTVTEKVMAIIVVPPLNRNPLTKERPKGNMSSLPPSEIYEDPSITPREIQRPQLPLCTFHSTASMIAAAITDGEKQPKVSHPPSPFRIPLYNGVTLFPDPAQRAALLSLLCKVLASERKTWARNQRRESETFSEADQINSSSISPVAATKDDNHRGSHAFVIYSDAHTALTADMAGVGLALWRIPMFEGIGWISNSNDDREKLEEKEKGMSYGTLQAKGLDSDMDGSLWVERYKYHSMFGDERYRIRV